MTQAIKRVYFSAMVPSIDAADGTVKAWHCLPVDFTVQQKGPCGKFVERLDVAKVPGALSIIQYCADGEAKEFLYLDKDIVGRVHVVHREGRPNGEASS